MNPRRKSLEFFFWMLVPGSITLALFVVCLVPKHLWGLGAFMPILPIIPIFYWGVLRAREISYWFAFAIGLLTDAVLGTPLGLSAFLYAMFLACVHAQHKYIHKEGFVIIWGYFAIMLGVMQFLQWVFMSFSGTQMHSVGPAMMQWFFTVCFYPVLHMTFNILSDFIQLRRWKLIHV